MNTPLAAQSHAHWHCLPSGFQRTGTRSAEIFGHYLRIVHWGGHELKAFAECRAVNIEHTAEASQGVDKVASRHIMAYAQSK